MNGPAVRLAVALLLAGPALAPPGRTAAPATLLADFPRGHLILETAGPRCLGLDVFLALSPDQRARGLMYVESLEEFEGMWFAYPEEATIVMWMQNTYLPLDMAFIRADGSVAGIAARTTPLSTERIRSPEPVVAVLEVNGGFAERWGLRPDTRVLALALAQAQAQAPAPGR